MMSGIVFLITVSMGSFLNVFWYALVQRGLPADWGYSFSSSMGFFGGASILGIAFGLWHARGGRWNREYARSLLIGIGSYSVAMAVFEIFWLHPWSAVVTVVDGVTHSYNAYQLDALYGTPLIVVLIILAILMYLLSRLLFLGWQRLRTLR